MKGNGSAFTSGLSDTAGVPFRPGGAFRRNAGLLCRIVAPRGLTVALLVAVVVLLAAGAGFAGEIDGNLASKLTAIDPDEFVRVMVRMEEQPFVSRAMGPELTRFVLREAADRTQAPLMQYVRAQQSAGDVKAFTGFWIVNVVFVEIRAGKVADLSRLPGVAFVYEDAEVTSTVVDMTPAESGPNLLRWDHVAAVFAPEVWELGYRGQGITVAVIDTGVDISHPELVGAMGGTAPYHEGYWAEFDSNGQIVPGSMPHDSSTHGTHVSGTVAGRNVEHRIGVAPEVTLAHGLVIPRGTGSTPQVLAGMQWVAEQGFDVINGSLGVNDMVPDMAVATDNLYAAGVVPIFANGNIRLGSVPPGAPGNTPSAVAVGAYDMNGAEASFNRGAIIEYPGYEYDQFTRIKPDISAPGVDILSAYPGGRWAHANGTSMASPHVAGVVALLLSAYPDLSVDEMKHILFASTGGHKNRYGWDDIPTKDIHFGWGRINALQALQLAGGPGDVPVSVFGKVTGDDIPLVGASVTYGGLETAEFITDEDGEYAGQVLPGIYTVTARAPGHESEIRTVNLIDTDGSVQIDFDLKRMYTGTLAGTVTSVATWLDEPGPVAGATVRIPDLDLQTTTDEEGEYVFEFVRVGEWSVRVEHAGYHAQRRTATVTRDETTVVDFVLDPLGGVVSFRNSFDTTAERAQWSLFDLSGAGDWVFTGRRAYSQPFSASNANKEDEAAYPADQRAGIESPPFTVHPGGAALTFRLWADLWGPFHAFELSIRDVETEQEDVLYVFDAVAETDGWMRVGFDLSEYSGRRVILAFSTEIDELTRPDDAGVFIDDVVVAAPDPELPSRLRGRVTEGGSRAVVGALVTAVQLDGSGQQPLVLQTMSGRNGNYELALAGGRWAVHVSKTATHVPTERTIYIDPGDRNSVSFSLQPNTPPTRVSGLEADPKDGAVQLTWNEAPDADLLGYNVYVSRNGAPYRRTAATTDTTYTVTGLEGGETYSFKVAAMDEYGLEGEAAEVDAVPEDPEDPEDPVEHDPIVTMFDVKPRSVTRGGSVIVSAELDHEADEDAVLHVRVLATLGEETIGEWEFEEQSLGAFSTDVRTVDTAGKPWNPNVYEMRLIVTDADGHTAISNTIHIALLPPLPRSLSFLLGNNPFDPSVQSQLLEYSVPTAGHVHMAVYTLNGRRLRTIVDEQKEPGRYAAHWDGTDDDGVTVLAGMYVVRVRFVDGDGVRVELTRHSVVVK